jgi:hypothetical protein
MNEFRYVVRKNRVTTEQVRAWATEYDIPLSLAKRECEDTTGPTLQYRTLSISPEWKDVEIVAEYRE